MLAVSPSFLDQYISAARVVTNRALGAPGTKATSVTYRPARGTDQAVRVDGLPLGTRGGLMVEHNFPADGDYKLNISGLPIAGYLRGMEYQHTVMVLLDGAKIFENTIGGPEDLKAIDQQQAAAVTAINSRFQNIPLKVTAGPHKVGVTFVARTLAESDDVLHLFRPGAGEERIPKIGSVEVLGPFTAEGLGDTPEPPARAGVQAGDARPTKSACAKRILVDAGAPRLSPPGDASRIWPRRWRSTPRAARARISRPACARRCRPFSPAPSSCIAPSARPAGVAAGTVHRITAARPGVAAVVLPHRPRPRRRAAARWPSGAR